MMLTQLVMFQSVNFVILRVYMELFVDQRWLSARYLMHTSPALKAAIFAGGSQKQNVAKSRLRQDAALLITALKSTRKCCPVYVASGR